MKYINNIENIQLEEDTVITLGKFDGLHEGHRELMETMFSVKRDKGYKALIFTFNIPPRNMISGQDMPVITTNLEKRRLFQEIGVDYFVECPFSTELMHMPAKEFVAFLVEKLGVKCFVVGTDFKFGYQRQGTHATLTKLADKYGYEVFVREKVQYEGRDISSTFIRETIAAGQMECAAELMGYPYFIENEIVHGNHIGRTMEIPTVNMEIPPEKIIPPKGVYVAEIEVDGRFYMGAANVGNKPTIGDNYPTAVETFLFDFDGDLYGRILRVYLHSYIRPELKFDSLDELKEQMDKDIRFAKEYHPKKRVQECKERSATAVLGNGKR